MEAAGDLFIKENIADGVIDDRVHAEGEFTHIAGAFVDIQDLVHVFRVVAGGLDDLAVLEFETHVPEEEPIIGRGAVVADIAVDGVLHRGGVDLTVGNVAVAVHAEAGDVLDGEGEVRAGRNDVYLVGAVHQGFQMLHGPSHLVIVHQASLEIEILIFLGGYTGQLGHGVIGIAEDAPLGVVAALVQVNGAPVILAIAALGLITDIVPHADIGSSADIDVGIHVLHALQFIGCDLRHVFRICPGHQSSLHIIVKDVDERLAACGVGLLYQGFHESGLAAVQLNENLFTILQANGTVDQKLCEFPDSGVFHVVSPFKAYR